MDLMQHKPISSKNNNNVTLCKRVRAVPLLNEVSKTCRTRRKETAGMIHQSSFIQNRTLYYIQDIDEKS
jgi:hypothetical protein